ncbi:MAG: hypothetical protein LC808_32080 [Actinobacteria bacterium]|nr:hypothetical protein [Actinomycetota bacterium]
MWRTIGLIAAVIVFVPACGEGASPVSDTPATSVTTAVKIVATDFAFEISPQAIPAGVVETTLVNEGEEPHQAGYYRLNDGVTFEDFVTAVTKDDSMITQLAETGGAGHLRPLSGGERGVRPGDDLEPGEYAVLCSIRDPETGKNHYELGMSALLTVK